jgi:penicillin-binding protein-related factor A (putative recombinase)
MRWKIKNNRGTAFERELGLLFDAYRGANRADIQKVEAPTKVFGAGKAKRTIHLTNPFLDYVGAWTERSGRMIQLEAKHTESPRLALGGADGLTRSQWDAARAWDKAGAMVLLLWQYRDEVRVTTPHLAMHAAQINGRKSIRWADAYRMPAGLGFIRYDPLAWADQL